VKLPVSYPGGSRFHYLSVYFFSCTEVCSGGRGASILKGLMNIKCVF